MQATDVEFWGFQDSSHVGLFKLKRPSDLLNEQRFPVVLPIPNDFPVLLVVNHVKNGGIGWITLWKIIINGGFIGKIICKWAMFHAMLNYQRVNPYVVKD